MLPYLVRSFPGVYSEMSTQVGDLYKLAVAVGTVVRLLARVQPHVCLQVVVPREPLNN